MAKKHIPALEGGTARANSIFYSYTLDENELILEAELWAEAQKELYLCGRIAAESSLALSLIDNNINR